MKPRVGIKGIEFKWKKCKSAFFYITKPIPMFSSGGGSYQDFGFPDINHYQKHFYFYDWCYLTIRGARNGE